MADLRPPDPLVAVVLPVREEGDRFAETLARVLGQDYPAERLEVLAVDGMSRDATREIVRSAAARDPRLRLLDNPGRIVPTAMNVGVTAARGEVVVRVDGHTMIAEDYVRRCVEALRRTGADCVGGKMVPRGDSFVGRLVAAATSGPFGVGDSHFHYSDRPRYTDSVYLGAWPREALLRMGGFDEEMVRDQDDELSYRIRERGGRVYLDPSIRSEYRPRGDFWRLFRQYFGYGFWKVRVFQKHARTMRVRHFVPAAFVLGGLGSVAAALAGPAWGRWTLASGAALYLGAGWAAAFRGPGTLAERLALPAAYLIIHSAYGSGFLAGLIRFFPRWFERGSSPRGSEGAARRAGGPDAR